MGDYTRFAIIVVLLPVHRSSWLPSYVNRELGCGLPNSEEANRIHDFGPVGHKAAKLSCQLSFVCAVSLLFLSCVLSQGCMSSQRLFLRICISMYLPIRTMANRMGLVELSFCATFSLLLSRNLFMLGRFSFKTRHASPFGRDKKSELETSHLHPGLEPNLDSAPELSK